MPQEFTFGKYKFCDFEMMRGETVRCRVRTGYFDITEEDERNVTSIIEKTGNWEKLVKSGLDLLAELGIAKPIPVTEHNINIPFGFELYEFRVSPDNSNACLWVFFNLTAEERRRRLNAEIKPIIQIEEITNQIANIPKWLDFEETIKRIKDLK